MLVALATKFVVEPHEVVMEQSGGYLSVYSVDGKLEWVGSEREWSLTLVKMAKASVDVIREHAKLRRDG